MLKSRNSFFSQSSMNYQNNYPTPTNPYNIETGSSSNTYYQGPISSNPNYNNYLEDYDNRISKIERSINRLDARITKLENQKEVTTNDINSTMYMV